MVKTSLTEASDPAVAKLSVPAEALVERAEPAGPGGIAAEVMRKARASGLLNEKGSRIGGRVSAALLAHAKRQTGITENTQLIEFALASLAIEDGFSEAFKGVKGAIDPAVKLGF